MIHEKEWKLPRRKDLSTQVSKGRDQKAEVSGRTHRQNTQAEIRWEERVQAPMPVAGGGKMPLPGKGCQLALHQQEP